MYGWFLYHIALNSISIFWIWIELSNIVKLVILKLKLILINWNYSIVIEAELSEPALENIERKEQLNWIDYLVFSWDIKNLVNRVDPW